MHVAHHVGAAQHPDQRMVFHDRQLVDAVFDHQLQGRRSD
jgi:hypothetical protein